MSEPRYFAIIASAGTGSRMQSTVPKQYLTLQNKPLLFHTLQTFDQSQLFQHILLVVPPEDTQGVEIAQSFHRITTVEGGARRSDSVRNGLQALSSIASPTDWVFVHDAARPLISIQDIHRLADALKHDDVGGILGVPIRDTLKKCDTNGVILNTVDREGLWAAQTPQAFRYHVLQSALRDPDAAFTDEAAAVEQLGLKVNMVKGSITNFKMTYPEDLLLAESMMTEETTCV